MNSISSFFAILPYSGSRRARAISTPRIGSGAMSSEQVLHRGHQADLDQFVDQRDTVSTSVSDAECSVCSRAKHGSFGLSYDDGKPHEHLCARCRFLENVVRICVAKQILPLPHGTKRGKLHGEQFRWRGIVYPHRWGRIHWTAGEYPMTMFETFRVFSLPGMHAVMWLPKVPCATS
jgi:hypothetical protein